MAPPEATIEQGDAARRGADRLRAGPLEAPIEDGALRVFFDGVEVLRRIDCPIRDADWRTLEIAETEAAVSDGARRYRRAFRTADGAFEGVLQVDCDEAPDGAGARLTARLELRAQREALVNRAGFILLHPLAGVVGAAVELRRPDGTLDAARFPERIAPGQPVMDIAGLRHRIGGVSVEIAMEGEVFEMEDQRNWTDASFKTYCRPLARPRPFAVAAGETLRQQITLRLSRSAGAAPAEPAGREAAPAMMPAIMLAHEAGLTGAPPAAVARLGAEGVLLRLDADVAAGAGIEAARRLRAPVTLELVTGPDVEADVRRAKADCAAAGVLPARVVGVPQAYLSSHQPEGPWPEGPGPGDVAAALRAAFPEAEVGGGMLTNFTEFNRRPPDPEAVDFATFGTSAIVHAADDRSVLQTLEALGDVFASARALAGGKPLRLGLLSIGMRSNPYGAAVAENPDGRRVAMAIDDPRQRGLFAAAWAVGVAAAAARGGVASYAPAMTGGPLGLGRDGALWPLFHVVAALAALGAVDVEVSGGGGEGLVRITGAGRRGVTGIVANLGPAAARIEARGRVLDAASLDEAARDANWIEGPCAGAATLRPLAVAILKAEAA